MPGGRFVDRLRGVRRRRTVSNPRLRALGIPVLAIVLAGAACSTATPDDAGPSTGPAPTSTTELRQDESDEDETDDQDSLPEGWLKAEEVLAVVSELDGQLAIGNGPTVAVARPDGLAHLELDGGQTNLASQPTWSTDGSRLIWSSDSAQAHEARVQAFTEDGEVDGPWLVSNVPGQPIFYFQWSSDDSTIAYLRNSVRPSLVEAGVVGPGQAARWVADDAPFFFSWAPDSGVFAGHVGDERLAIFDPGEALEFGLDQESSEESLRSRPSEDPVAGDDLATGGGFSSPAWLDSKTVLAVVDGQLSRVNATDGLVSSLLKVNGPIRFVLSPDRTKVALQLAPGSASDDVLEAALPSGGQRSVQTDVGDQELIVLDIETGRTTAVTDQNVVLAWEWSPDSSKLAWLETGGSVPNRRARWRFWSGDQPVGGDVSSPIIQLSIKELVNYLPFFAQYTHSISRWSPDSSAFALAGSIGGRAGIWIHLVDQVGEPVLVASGDFVSWGSGPTPSPTAGRSPA